MPDITIPYYWKSLDWDALMADYPPPPMFNSTVGRMSADALRELQERRFKQRMREAWQVKFYRDRWTAAGLEEGDVTGLDDLHKVPMFTSDDLKAAIEEDPPFGSHHPIGRNDLGRFPIKLQTSGGTTGMPRVTLFDTVAWEVQGIQLARALFAQGARPGDLIQIPFTNALGNAPWCAYTAIHHWLGAVPITSGSGTVTPSERQLEYALAWGTNGWYSMGEYYGRLAEVAQQIGFDLHQLPTRYLHAYLGPDVAGAYRKKLEEAWGAPVYDNYGTHEVGLIAWECAAKDGMHLNEDTVYVETVDVDSSELLPLGERGNLVATSLHRSVPPIIRYNLRDVLMVYDRRECECGLKTKKLSTFLGRSDEMVKLRGQNVYPRACQTAVTKDERATGEFLCVVSTEGEGLTRREQMTVRVERKSADVDAAQLRVDMLEALHRDLGVRIDVEIVDPGALAEFTRLGGEGKVRRLLDLRKPHAASSTTQPAS